MSMWFKKELAIKIIQGKKTQTIRKDPRLKVGQIYSVQVGPRPPVARIEITEKREITLGELTEEDAKREGFETLKEFKEYWTRILGLPWNTSEKYYAYKFELVEIMEENLEKQGLKDTYNALQANETT